MNRRANSGAYSRLSIWARRCQSPGAAKAQQATARGEFFAISLLSRRASSRWMAPVGWRIASVVRRPTGSYGGLCIERLIIN